MKLSEQIVSKGIYNYSSANAPVDVLQFVFIRQRGLKCLLLRFRNNSEFTLNKMEYEVVQLDKKGNEISRTTVKTPPLNEAPNSIFSLSDGLVVNEECSDFRINFISLSAENYKYTFIGNEYIVSFEPTQKKNLTSSFSGEYSEKDKLILYSKKQSSFNFALAIAIVAAMIIFSIVLFSYWGANIL